MKKRVLCATLVGTLALAGVGLVLASRASVASAASSRHAAIHHGVGNIVVGEALPYGNDAAWRNAVPSGGTLRASQAFRTWREFTVRSFFRAPLRDIGWEGHRFNAVAYLLVFLLPNGQVYQPPKRPPAILYFYGERGSSDAAYMARDSHAGSWRGRVRRDWPVGYFQVGGTAIDVNDPRTFQLSHGRDVTRGQFQPWQNGPDLRNALRAGGGKLKLRIYAKVFKFKGTRSIGGGREDLGRHKNTWWHDYKWTIKMAKQYDAGTLVAKGEWTIVP